jgi:hypothetical protein
MSVSKLQRTAAVLLTCAVMTAGGTWAVAQRPGDAAPADPPPPAFEPLKAQGDAGELRKLLVDRYNTAAEEYALRLDRYTAGSVGLDELYDALFRLRDAGLEVYDGPADRVALSEKLARQTAIIEELTTARFEVGRLSRQDMLTARYHRIDAGIRLLREQQKSK